MPILKFLGRANRSLWRADLGLRSPDSLQPRLSHWGLTAPAERGSARGKGGCGYMLTNTQTIPEMRIAECAQDTGNEGVTCVENSIFVPVPEIGAARIERRGSFCPPRHRVMPPTVFGRGARTISVVPAGTRYVGSSDPPLKTVGYYRSSLRDCGSFANISQRAEGRGHEIPESGFDFIVHDTDGEWVMRLKCPEFSGQAATSSVFGGKDAEARRPGDGGSLTAAAPRSAAPNGTVRRPPLGVFGHLTRIDGGEVLGYLMKLGRGPGADLEV